MFLLNKPLPSGPAVPCIPSLHQSTLVGNIHPGMSVHMSAWMTGSGGKATVKSGHSAPMPSGSQEAPAQVFWMVSRPSVQTSGSHVCDDSPSSSHCFPKFMQLELSRRLDRHRTPPGERQP